MKVLVQWTQATPADWIEVDSSAYSILPALDLPLPSELGPRDTQLGWIHRLNIQGVTFTGDHYAVEDVPGGCRVTVWWDDIDSYPDGEWFAQVWTFLEPAADPALGGQMNTRQSKVIYAQPGRMQFFADHYGVSVGELDTMVEGTVFRPWSDFVPPPALVTRHGVWTSDELNVAHEAAQSVRGWREWIVGG